jgi:peptidyl-prolyl cis-trans isomerase C
MTISVNGVMIGEDAVGRELQYHPASSQEEAAWQATTALVVRELLLQRAREIGIEDIDEDAAVGELVAREVVIPEPLEEEIARYYRQNGLRFRTPALYEAAHIFFPARIDDDAAREEAKTMAEAVLQKVLATPHRFAELAKAYSACSSKEQGGFLGQISRGDTNPEVESLLATMEPGTIYAAPASSRHGYHILRLDRREEGRDLPLEQVKDWIADHLRKSSHRRAISQYLQILAAKAEISGFDLAAPDSFLVQ